MPKNRLSVMDVANVDERGGKMCAGGLRDRRLIPQLGTVHSRKDSPVRDIVRLRWLKAKRIHRRNTRSKFTNVRRGLEWCARNEEAETEAHRVRHFLSDRPMLCCSYGSELSMSIIWSESLSYRGGAGDAPRGGLKKL